MTESFFIGDEEGTTDHEADVLDAVLQYLEADEQTAKREVDEALDAEFRAEIRAEEEEEEEAEKQAEKKMLSDPPKPEMSNKQNFDMMYMNYDEQAETESKDMTPEKFGKSTDSGSLVSEEGYSENASKEAEEHLAE